MDVIASAVAQFGAVGVGVCLLIFGFLGSISKSTAKEDKNYFIAGTGAGIGILIYLVGKPHTLLASLPFVFMGLLAGFVMGLLMWLMTREVKKAEKKENGSDAYVSSFGCLINLFVFLIMLSIATFIGWTSYQNRQNLNGLGILQTALIAFALAFCIEYAIYVTVRALWSLGTKTIVSAVENIAGDTPAAKARGRGILTLLFLLLIPALLCYFWPAISNLKLEDIEVPNVPQIQINGQATTTPPGFIASATPQVVFPTPTPLGFSASATPQGFVPTATQAGQVLPTTTTVAGQPTSTTIPPTATPVAPTATLTPTITPSPTATLTPLEEVEKEAAEEEAKKEFGRGNTIAETFSQLTDEIENQLGTDIKWGWWAVFFFLLAFIAEETQKNKVKFIAVPSLAFAAATILATQIINGTPREILLLLTVAGAFLLWLFADPSDKAKMQKEFFNLGIILVVLISMLIPRTMIMYTFAIAGFAVITILVLERLSKAEKEQLQDLQGKLDEGDQLLVKQEGKVAFLNMILAFTLPIALVLIIGYWLAWIFFGDAVLYALYCIIGTGVLIAIGIVIWKTKDFIDDRGIEIPNPFNRRKAPPTRRPWDPD